MNRTRAGASDTCIRVALHAGTYAALFTLFAAWGFGPLMGRDWTSGSTRAWRRLRAQILTRDQHRCRLQLDGCSTIATEAHHLDGKTRGDNPDRLVAACKSCNLKVGEPTHHDPQPQPRTDW